MMQHLGQLMTIHGSILLFTHQGVGKHNDNIFSIFVPLWRASLQQLIEKQNRIEHLYNIAAKRQRTFEIECSNCCGLVLSADIQEHCQHALLGRLR